MPAEKENTGHGFHLHNSCLNITILTKQRTQRQLSSPSQTHLSPISLISHQSFANPSRSSHQRLFQPPPCPGYQATRSDDVFTLLGLHPTNGSHPIPFELSCFAPRILVERNILLRIRPMRLKFRYNNNNNAYTPYRGNVSIGLIIKIKIKYCLFQNSSIEL